MEIRYETVGPFAENSYFVFDEETREAVAIDPGDEPERLLRLMEAEAWKIKYILNTHAHIDHVGAVEAVKEHSGAPFYLPEAELPLLEALPMQAAMFGLSPPPTPQVDEDLKEGDVFKLAGGIEIEVFSTPGHSPGSVSFRVGDVLIVGDTLFQGSIGRTDLPGGDLETLLSSIRDRLMAYPDQTVVYPGHGPPTTIGDERRDNPFLQPGAFE